METAISDICAVKFTPSRAGDSQVLPELSDLIPGGKRSTS